MKSKSMGNQIKNNAVALISLIVAFIALGYNTWRNEHTEKNRNIRMASFEVLKSLGELQLVVNYAQYQPDNTMGNPILGWGYIALIGDLSHLLPSPVPEQAAELIRVWGTDWNKIKTDEKSADLISNQIDGARSAVLGTLYSLH